MKLQINDISKSYGSTQALKSFCAEFTPGIYALLGPNGSGKTTLMNILTGNLRADAGNITFTDRDGRCENMATMGKRFRAMLGFMPQYPGMYASFTLEEFLQYVATLKGVGEELPKKQRDALIKAQIDGVLQAVELSDVARHKIGSLSGGMKQRLALAQAVLGDSKILILDEPTAGLDPKQRIAVRNYISRIAMGKIVIIATHVVSDVEFIAKEIIMLRKGEIIQKAPGHEFLQQLDGKVWTLCVPEGEIAAVQSTFSVTNISAAEHQPGMAVLRVLCDDRPAPDACEQSPTLEDYYLYVFGQQA